jgi:hypothetical protein
VRREDGSVQPVVINNATVTVTTRGFFEFMWGKTL